MWAVYLLAQNPAVEQTLHGKVSDVLQGRAARFSDYSALSYAEWVIREAMRLYPPAPNIGREAAADAEIGGFRIEKGTMVFASAWVNHRLEQYFPQAEVFRPERWADELHKKLPRFAYFPFGGGPRICIGNTFAMMEATLVLATLVQRYRFELMPEPQVVPVATLTLRAKHGMAAKVHVRA
jgi:cytochrome P450